ncbi:MAG: peptidoglycan editing factor PgeF [Lachnospiraceae bacterium]|nr:peptidoglycan editing factor PgeF [Lachnospiraceae bacterium]
MREKFDLGINKDTIFANLEKNIKYINNISYDSDDRTTYVALYKKEEYVPVIKYKIFDEYSDVISGFSTRLGGVSKEHLSSMNLSFSRGDDKENVIENHKRFADAVGYDYKKLVFSDQVHTTNIHVVTKDDAGKGIVIESDIKNTDGLVTNCYNIPLITFYADCVPIYFYDPVKKVVGLAHSGWKGTASNIAKSMVDKMKESFSCNEEDIICAIGPSICQKCYEVDNVVTDIIKANFSKDEYDEVIIDKHNGKYQLDLHKLCRINLLNCGIKAEHIAMPDICTCCNDKILFSHRASNGKRGNLAAVIMLYND